MHNQLRAAERLALAVLECGASHSAIMSVENIVFNEQLRDMCAMNTCGKYDTCWVCPPALAPVSEWRKKIEGFERGVLIQTVYQLEDSFDYEGMVAAKELHTRNFLAAVDAVHSQFDFAELLVLNAGACELCPSCTYPHSPCRFPQKAIVSVEACGIDVNKTLVNCGLKYNNGEATVSYVGMILYKEK